MSAVWRTYLALFGAVGLFGLFVFGSAGRIDLPFVWAYLAVQVVVVVVGVRVIDPALRRERFRPGPGGEDRHLRKLAMPFFGAHLVVAGLDVGRFHWSDGVPAGLQIAALGGLAMAYGLSISAIAVNEFFSPVVRIQAERGHHLITGGPYRWIRHPGYAAAFVMMLCSGVVLGSWWSMAAIAPAFPLMVRRVIIEDRFLHENLDGYRDYAARVCYRVIPGIW